MALTLTPLVSSTVSASSTASLTTSGSPSASPTSEAGSCYFSRLVFGQCCYYCGAGGLAGPDGVGFVEDGLIGDGIEVHIRNLVADD